MRRHIFADEAGCLTFKRGENISTYFILVTISLESCEIEQQLLELRRSMAWEGLCTDKVLHATTDPQAVRDKVFDLIQKDNFRIDATILDKTKAAPRIRPSDIRFYKYAWYYHLKHVGPRVCSENDEVYVSAASIGTRKKRAAFKDAIDDVLHQSIPKSEWRTVFWPADSDPCLQVADYCAWAIQRKWEMGDSRSYSLIEDKIISEFDLFALGRQRYY